MKFSLIPVIRKDQPNSQGGKTAHVDHPKTD
jgi:hypothetical protein